MEMRAPEWGARCLGEVSVLWVERTMTSCSEPKPGLGAARASPDTGLLAGSALLRLKLVALGAPGGFGSWCLPWERDHGQVRWEFQMCLTFPWDKSGTLKTSDHNS